MRNRRAGQPRTILGVMHLEDRVTPSVSAAPVRPITDASAPTALRTNLAASLISTTATLIVATAAPVVNKPLNLNLAIRPAAGTLSPTGAITIKDGDRVLGTVQLQNAQATFSNSGLAAGVHRLSIAYGGDDQFAQSTSATVTVTISTGTVAAAVSSPVTPPQLPTTGTGAAACVIVVPPSPVSSRQPITLGAEVNALRPSSPLPTGRVTFRKGSTVLGSAVLNAAGVAQLTLPAGTLPAGQYYLSAYYEGNVVFGGDGGADLLVVTA